MDKIIKRQERISIMEILYLYDINDNYVCLRQNDDYSEFVTEIVNYVCLHKEEIDDIITKSLTNYRLSRLSVVDRSLVRMGVAELKMATPKAIVINEILEIAKEYSDEGDGKAVRFLNKLLDNVTKTMGK